LAEIWVVPAASCLVTSAGAVGCGARLAAAGGDADAVTVTVTRAGADTAPMASATLYAKTAKPV
jgi:hypothetical protein